MEEAFNIRLISNVSPDVFPDNRPSHFSTILADEIALNGNWDVAVKDIMYPTTIASTTPKDQLYFHTYDYGIKDRKIIDFPYKKLVLMEPYTYEKDKILIKAVLNEEDAKSLVYHKRFKRRDYPPDTKKTYPKYFRKHIRTKAFHFTNTEAGKFKLHVPKDIVVGLDGITRNYLGFINEFFTEGVHWAWTARGFEEQVTSSYNFRIYDLNFYEKKEYVMKYSGTSFKCDEIGLEIRNGEIVDHYTSDYLFFKIESHVQKRLYSRHS